MGQGVSAARYTAASDLSERFKGMTVDIGIVWCETQGFMKILRSPRLSSKQQPRCRVCDGEARVLQLRRAKDDLLDVYELGVVEWAREYARKEGVAHAQILFRRLVVGSGCTSEIGQRVPEVRRTPKEFVRSFAITT